SEANEGKTMRSVGGKVLLKVSLIVVGVVLLALGASIVLTDPDRATLFLRARRWLAAPAGGPSASTRVAPRAGAEPAGRGRRGEAFDDSGYSTAFRFSKPIADPTSLASIQDSVVGRGSRGIAYLQGLLASQPPELPASRSAAVDIHLILGSLMMHEGRCAAAGEAFAAA